MKSLNMKLVGLKRKKSDQVDTEEHEQVDTEIEHGTTPQNLIHLNTKMKHSK